MNRIWKWETVKLLTLLAVVLIGFYYRVFIGLTTELWGDESTSMRISTTQSYQQLLEQGKDYADYTHPSGYYIVLKNWLAIGSFDANWARLLSLLFFLPSCWALYATVKNLNLGKDAAINSVILFSSHPMLVHLGYQARMYALTIFFSLLGLVFLLSKKPTSISLITSALCFAISMVLDYSSLWLIMTLPILSYFTYANDPALSKRILKTMVISCLLIFPQLLILIKNILFNPEIAPGSVPQNGLTGFYIMTHIGEVLGLGIVVTAVTLFFTSFLFGVCIYQLKTAQLRPLILMSFAVLVIPLLYSIIVNPIFLARHIWIVSILLCVIVGTTFIQVFRKKQFLVALTILAYGGVLIFKSWETNGFIYQTDLMAFSQKVAREGAKVLFLSPTLDGTLTEYYFIKAEVKPDQIRYVSENSSSYIVSHMNNAQKVYVVYPHTCQYDEYCNLQLEESKKICSLPEYNCELFKPL